MNGFQEEQSKITAASPIKNIVGSIFIPVRDIEKSREWYCRLLGLPADGPIMNGHLCPLPGGGNWLVIKGHDQNLMMVCRE